MTQTSSTTIYNRMRAIATILFILLFPLTAKAQTFLGARSGINYSKINGIGSAAYNYHWENGYHIGLFLATNIGEKLFFQPELVFSTRGYNFTKDYPNNKVISGDTIQLNQKSKLHYLDIPLLARLQMNNFYVEVGPQFGYVLSSKISNEHTLSSNGELTYIYSDQDSRSLVESLDIGFILGLGYQMKQGIGIGMRYDQGFRELVKGVNWQKNVLLQLTMSYMPGYPAYTKKEAEKRLKTGIQDEYYLPAKGDRAKTKNYRIIVNHNVQRVSIIKTGESVRSEVQFVFNSVGSSTPKNVLISGSSGTEEQNSLFTGFKNMETPFKGTIRYTVPVTLGTNSIESYLEFEINEPGMWRVNILTH